LYYAREQMQLQDMLSKQLSAPDRFRVLQQYDLSQKSPIERLLDLSSKSIVDQRELEQVLPEICEAALGILRVDYASVWMTGDTHHVFVRKAMAQSQKTMFRLLQSSELVNSPCIFLCMKN